MGRLGLCFVFLIFLLAAISSRGAHGQFSSADSAVIVPTSLPAPYNSIGMVGLPVVADFNNDHHQDMAVAVSGYPNGFMVLLGDGTGSFRAGPVIQPTATVCYVTTSVYDTSCRNPEVIAGDFNGDGNADVLLFQQLATYYWARQGNQFSSFALLYLGNGDGTFQPPSDVSNAVGAYGNVTAVDLRHNGRSDLVSQTSRGTVNYVPAPGPVEVALSNGDGTFQAPTIYPCPVNSECTGGMAVGDLGNGHPDIVYSIFQHYSASGFGILLGDGTGNFQSAPSHLETGLPSLTTIGQLALGHFSKGGKTDLLASYSPWYTKSTMLYRFTGNGDGSFANGVSLGFFTPPGGGALTLNGFTPADLNSDGVSDLAFTGFYIDSNGGTYSYTGWALGSGNGGLGTPTFLNVYDLQSGGCPIFGEMAPVVADLTGSGRPDLVNDVGSTCVALYFNTRNLRVGTGTTLTSSQNPETYPGRITLEAKVTGNAPPKIDGPTDPPGAVNLYDNGKLLASRLVVAGLATFDNLALPQGTHFLNATYSGNSLYYSSSAIITQVIQGSPTTTTLAITPTTNPDIFSHPVTLKATVSGQMTLNGKTYYPVGMVTFTSQYYAATRSGGVALGTYPLVNGVAQVTTPLMPVGTNEITAAYQGSSQFASSQSPDMSGNPFMVSGIPTSIVLVSSANPASAGSAVTFTATISRAAAPDPAQPNGYLHFYDGGTELGLGRIQSGVATFTTSGLVSGAHSITARYAEGSTAFAPSTSNVVSEQVN